MASNKTIKGSNSDDILRGGTGKDTIYGYGGNDSMDGAAGNDKLYGGSGNDILYGGKGTDILYGEAGDDNLHAGVLSGSTAGEDSLYGGDGNDDLYGDDGNNFLDGGKGNDWLNDEAGNDKLYGRDGDDTLFSGRAQLYGGKGNDYLSAGEGSTLDGGTGNDTLSSAWSESVGSRFIYRNGDGNDVISFNSSHDILDIRGADYSWKQSGPFDVLLTVGKGSILLKDAYGKTLTINDKNGKNRKVTFKKNTGKNISGSGTLNGTSGNDTISGSGNNIVLHGMAGDDYLYISPNSSVNSRTKGKLYGDAGDDYLKVNLDFNVSQGNYTLDGGKGNDTLEGVGSNSTLYGGDGNDYLTAGDHHASNTNMMDGGKGNDTLRVWNGVNTLYGGTGNDIVIMSECTNGKAYGGDGNDNLSAVNANNANMMDGGKGNDTLVGVGTNSTLLGGDGNDYLCVMKYNGNASNNSNDILDGGKGNDTLTLTLTERGDENRNSTLRGGKGNDLLIVEANNYDNYDNKVRYIYANGDGNDTIANFNSNHDILDLRGADYSWKKSGTSDVRITVGEGSILLQGVYGQAIKINDKNNKTKTVRLTTSKTLGKCIEGTASGETLRGGNGNDAIYGFDGNDYLMGGSGNDKICGGYGKDTLYGGKGNDTLEGGYGKNRFIYKNGDGNDTITDFECCKWICDSSGSSYSKEDILDLQGVDCNGWKKSGKSDVLLTLGKGSVLLKDAYGKSIEINDRNGKTKYLTFEENRSGNAMMADVSSYWTEDEETSYVDAEHWNLASAMDDIAANKQSASETISPNSESLTETKLQLYAGSSNSLTEAFS